MAFVFVNMNLDQLLHPELLNENELRCVLNERFIRVDNIENLNKEQLLSLFYRVATPLQQRMRNVNRKVNGAQSAVVTTESVFATKTSKSPEKSTGENENCVKKIKLGNNNKVGNSVNHKIHLKRTYDNDDKSVDSEVPSNKKTRQKICWP